MTKYTQTQIRRRNEIVRNVDGKPVTYVRFQGVLRYKVPNPNFVQPPAEGEPDTRTAPQKRQMVWREVCKMLEAEKVTAGRMKQEKKDAQTEENINNALNTWREEMEAEEDDLQSQQTVYELVKDYVDRREAESAANNWDSSVEMANGERVIQRSTVRDYRHTMTRIEPTFSKVGLADLTAKLLLDWENEKLCGGYKVTTIRKCHVLIKSAMNDAVVRGIIDSSPIASLKSPTMKWTSDDKGMSYDDMRVTTGRLEKLNPSPGVIGAALALHAGLRGGECCGLQWKDIDFEARTIHVCRAVGIADGGCYIKKPKSASGDRLIYMADFVYGMLIKRRAFMLAQGKDFPLDLDTLYVIGNIDGSYMSPTTLTRKWTSLSESWGLLDLRGTKLTFHGLRHSFATAMRVTKGNVNEAKNRVTVMGHSTVEMTERYGARDWLAEAATVVAASEFMTPRTKNKTDSNVLPFAAAAG